MSDLTDTAQLGRETGLTEEQVIAILEGAGLQAVYSSGALRVYQREKAVTALEAYAEEQRRSDPAHVATLVDRVGTLVAMEFKESEDRDSEILGLLKKLVDQNILIMRAVEALKTGVLSRPEPLEVLPAATPALVGPAKTSRLRVAVIGLINSQKTLIEDEFGVALDLRLYLTDEAKGKHFSSAIGNCDVAVTMVSFINHSVESMIKASGTRLVRVSGGMTALRDLLTQMFVKPDDYRRKLAA